MTDIEIERVYGRCRRKHAASEYATHLQVRAQRTNIDRVPQCMSPRRNWDSPSPSLASECAPSPEQKWGAHSPAGEGVGESQFRRREKA
jgi:hypothetical protein